MRGRFYERDGRMRTCLFPLALLAAACTPQADEGEPPVETTATAAPTVTSTPEESSQAEQMQADTDADDACGAGKVTPWIGRESTVPVRSAVAKAAGAASDRWIYPDSVVTQDFRPDRLNVVMEKGSDKIVSAHCG